MKQQDYDHFAASLDEDAGLAGAINSVAAYARNTGASGQFGTEPLPKSTVVLTCGTDLTPEPVQWLWPDWLALGKFHLLAGAPGQGKTTIAMGMAATVTIGGRWPDGSCCDAGNVLIWSGEDDYTDTLLPRLLAAGADRSRVFFVDGTRVGSAVSRADTIRKRLGWEAGILNPPGGKPKGMHWRTFERLQAAHDAHTNQALAGMAAKLGLAIGRLEGIQTRWMSLKSNQY